MASKAIKKTRAPQKPKSLIVQSQVPTDFGSCSHKKDREEKYVCLESLYDNKRWYCQVGSPLCLKCATTKLGIFEGNYYCKSHYPHRLECGHITDQKRICNDCRREACNICDDPGYNNGYCKPCFERFTLLKNKQCLKCQLPISPNEEKMSAFGYHIKCIPDNCDTCGKQSVASFNYKRLCKDCLFEKFQETEKKTQSNII